MKKVLALIIAGAMMLTLLAGCDGGKSGVSAAPSSGPEASGGGTGIEKPTIGMIWYGTDDDLGKTVKAYIDHAAELVGCEVKWALGDFDAASQLKSAENLIAAGVDALMWLPIDDTTNAQVGQLCQQNQVYFSIMFRDIGDPTIKENIQNNPYFVSNIHEDERAVGKELMQCLVDNGVTKIGCNSKDETSGLTAARYGGMEDGLTVTDITLSGTFQASNSGDAQTYINGITNLLNVYPDMDGFYMITGALGVGTVIINTLQGLVQPGDVKIAGFDTYEGMKKDFEAGWLVGMAGGMAPDALFSFICMYNKLNGTPLSDEPIWLLQKEVIVKNAEQCDAYEKYIDKASYLIYTDEQIKSLIGKFNPDVTLDDVKAMMDQYTMEWVIENAHD